MLFPMPVRSFLMHSVNVFTRFSAALEAMSTIKAAEPCILIGQYLNSWSVTFHTYITHGIYHKSGNFHVKKFRVKIFRIKNFS